METDLQWTLPLNWRLLGGMICTAALLGFAWSTGILLTWYPAHAGAGISGATDTIDRAAARAIETNDGNVKARRDIQIVTLIIFCVLLTFLPG